MYMQTLPTTSIMHVQTLPTTSIMHVQTSPTASIMHVQTLPTASIMHVQTSPTASIIYVQTSPTASIMHVQTSPTKKSMGSSCVITGAEGSPIEPRKCLLERYAISNMGLSVIRLHRRRFMRSRRSVCAYFYVYVCIYDVGHIHICMSVHIYIFLRLYDADI